ncbi:Hypp8072 [Branchiostoma lanceolatum]|uniref:Hypp8072 protein n=1 Tax=Branchiostoma lanceolatum TaxID=7740 RepID=A0A8J9Z698_BRALA|nr:Hypp8072 [Branchiostoma lanceolatum]
MAQSTCQSERVSWLRKDRLARSTHVRKLVSSFEALTSQPPHAYTEAAGITPVQAMPDDADKVMMRRSVKDIKDELEGKTTSTPSEASVVNVRPQKPPRAMLLHDASPKSASTTEPQKPLCTQSLADTAVQTAAAAKQVEPASAQPLDVTDVKPPKPHLIGDTAGATSDDVEPDAEDLLRTLVLGDAAGDTKVTVKSSRTQSLIRNDAQRALAVRQEELLRTLLMGLPDETSQTTITVTPRKPVRRQSLAVKLVEPAPAQTLADATTRILESAPVLQPPQKPSRCRDYVMYRNNFGHYGFSLLTTFTPSMERCHVVFQAADSIAPLPVGRLVAVNFQPIQDKTAAELHDSFNRATESIRLRVQPLSFPLDVLQEMVADQVSPVTYQEHVDYRRDRRAHPARRWVKRKLRGVARATSQLRDAITCCWR